MVNAKDVPEHRKHLLTIHLGSMEERVLTAAAINGKGSVLTVTVSTVMTSQGNPAQMHPSVPVTSVLPTERVFSKESKAKMMMEVCAKNAKLMRRLTQHRANAIRQHVI